MIKEQYEKLRKQLNLPDFNKLNHEFEISTIDEEEFLLRNIRKKIIEKIDFLLKALHPVIEPEQLVSDMQEASHFSNDETTDAFQLYKQLKILDKIALEVSVDENDEDTAKFIVQVMNEWPEIKKHMKIIAQKMQKAWEKEKVSKEETGYLR